MILNKKRILNYSLQKIMKKIKIHRRKTKINLRDHKENSLPKVLIKFKLIKMKFQSILIINKIRKRNRV